MFFIILSPFTTVHFKPTGATRDITISIMSIFFPLCRGRSYKSRGSGTQGSDDILIIVIAAVGGSVVIVGLCVCTILVWCCLIQKNSKWNLRRSQKNNYKGNTSYILPYTIYGEHLMELPQLFEGGGMHYFFPTIANRSNVLEPFASNNSISGRFLQNHTLKDTTITLLSCFISR